MNKKTLWIVIGGILAVAAFLWFTKPAPQSLNSSIQPTNHLYGENSKGVTLVEYGDFQCPACKAYYPIVKDLKEKYKADIHFQFRNFPLKAIHQNALAASRAAEAADKQGKFWEMHDALYESQDAWAQSSDPFSFFANLAQQIGVTDAQKFSTDYRSSEVNAIISADEREAQKIGATSTPTFVLDGKVIRENPRDAEAFKKLIDDAIAAKAPKS